MINIDELTTDQKIRLISDKLFNSFLICYPNLHKEVFEKLAIDRDVNVRCNLTIKPNLPISVMEKLAEDEDWIRNSLAINPNLPVSIMEKLAEDEDSDVKYWLATNPSYQKYLLDKKNGNIL